MNMHLLLVLKYNNKNNNNKYFMSLFLIQIIQRLHLIISLI
jgi:hypothetical protein